MRLDSFEFEPVCKLYLATNERPKVADSTYGFWRRARMLPFEVSFPPDKRDAGLLDALKKEAPQIFALLVNRAMKIAEQGMPEPPPRVQAVTDEWQQENDQLGEFLNNCCEHSDGLQVGKREFHLTFVAWSGKKNLAQRSLSKLMKEQGYESGKHRETRRDVWLGLKVNDDVMAEFRDAT